MSIRSSWLMVVLISSVSLLIFCLLLLSIFERGVLKSSTITVNLSISPFSSMSVYFIDFVILVSTCIFRIATSS